GSVYTWGAGKSTAAPELTRAEACGATACACSVSSLTPASPEPDTAWYVATLRRSSPAASCSALSGGMAAIVVQLGLAMMPFGRASAASGFTSLTTRGTSSWPRHADELSM